MLDKIIDIRATIKHSALEYPATRMKYANLLDNVSWLGFD